MIQNMGSNESLPPPKQSWAHIAYTGLLNWPYRVHSQALHPNFCVFGDLGEKIDDSLMR